MKVNVDKVLERDAKLSELDSRAGTKLVHIASCRVLCKICFLVRKVFHCVWHVTRDFILNINK